MLTTSTMPRTGRGVGMNKSTTKKQVPIEPLQEPPNPMSPCEPAAPQVETFEEKVARATRSMSPEKSRVVRLCMEADARDKCCASMLECQRQCQRQVKFLKRSMRDVRARQNLVPKARTKKELAQRKADEEQLAAIRKRYQDYGHEHVVEHAYRVEAYMKYGNAKIARLERLLCDAGGEW